MIFIFTFVVTSLQKAADKMMIKSRLASKPHLFPRRKSSDVKAQKTSQLPHQDHSTSYSQPKPPPLPFLQFPLTHSNSNPQNKNATRYINLLPRAPPARRPPVERTPPPHSTSEHPSLRRRLLLPRDGQHESNLYRQRALRSQSWHWIARSG